MSDFLTRLKAERDDLNEKMQKLNSFIHSDKFDSVAPVQASLLKIQQQSMAAYLECLAERIIWLES